MVLTYETKDSNNGLERLEWDRVWVQNARDNMISRLVMVGDSITVGIMETFNDILNWQFPVDSFTSSKALDNPYLIPMIRLFLEQESCRNAIVFNNGLHGWHLKDETEYAEHYERTVVFLLETCPETPLFLSLCTHLADPDREARVIARNKVILTVAKKFDLPVIDLYTVSKNNANLLCKDGVHFSDYKPLCDEVLKHIAQFM